jgi:hypothetical protein
MPNEIPSIDPTILATISGGKHNSSVLSEINSIASQIKDVTKATSGMSSTQMLLLAAVFAQRNNANTNVVYVRSGRWW